MANASRRSGWLAALIVGGVWLGGCASQAHTPLLYANPGVRVERPSIGGLPFKPGMELQVGDIVQTAGGVAVIDFDDDNVVALREHTRIQLGSIRLFVGEVFARIGTIATRGGGLVITDELSASTKGTEYAVRRVTVPGRTGVGHTTVIVRQGTVACEDADRRRQPVSVTPNRLLRIEGKQPPQPLRVVNAKAETVWADEAIKFLRRWRPWRFGVQPAPIPHFIGPRP